MPPVGLLLKPASGSCNMRCRYCFYMDEMRHRETASFGMMSQKALQCIVHKAMAYGEGQVTFGFQGGEPTLAGIGFYRRLMEFERAYAKPGVLVQNTLQTNGYLIDAEWAAFLAKNKFLTGLSIDGPKELHDRNRMDAAGKGTHAKAMRAAQLLHAAGAEFNVLTVVTAQTARTALKTYNYFMRNNLRYMQFIPCIAPLDATAEEREHALSPAQYAQFLKTLFQRWHYDRMRGEFVFIRYFENLLMLLAGQPPESCGISGRCALQFVVEADGSVYPCDFYVLDEWKLGNLLTDSFEDLIASPRAAEFLRESHAIPEECSICPHFSLCQNGCKRDRLPLPEGGYGKSQFCEAYQAFFSYATPMLQELLHKLTSG